MCAALTEYGRGLKDSFLQFLDFYWHTKARYVAITLVPVLTALAGITDSRLSALLYSSAAGSIVLSLGYVYLSGRPFGISVSCRPTHRVEGTREPDVESETRGNVLLQDDVNKIHGQVDLSPISNSFKLKFESSGGIDVELENKPRAEHDYDPAENILECASVSDFQFPVKIGIYPAREVTTVGRYHTFAIIDKESDRVLEKFDVINVQG